MVALRQTLVIWRCLDAAIEVSRKRCFDTLARFQIKIEVRTSVLGNQHPTAVQAEGPVVLRLRVLRSGLRVGLEPLDLNAADALPRQLGESLSAAHLGILLRGSISAVS